MTLSFLFGILFFIGRGNTKLTSVIETDKGSVRGEIVTSINSIKYAAFKGIPYAQPPIGSLRFKPPVVVVSFNYRTSVFGFMNLNHEDASGNCGLKDKNLALKWVQRNIAKFGGNPNKVTIFGQSAGSVSVDMQVLSDTSVGLFQQSISMSGSTLCLYWGFQSSVEAEEQAFLLGLKLGVKTTNKDVLLKALLNISAIELLLADTEIGLIPFRPSLESTKVAVDQEKFLTECSLKKYLTGNFTKGPHIMGFTADETVSFAGSLENLLTVSEKALESINNGSLTSNSVLSAISSAITTGIENLSEAAIYNVIKDTTDIFFITGIDTKQQLLKNSNDYPIFYYRFSYKSNYSAHQTEGIHLDGVGHVDVLPYVFYMPSANLPLNNTDITNVRKKFIHLWTNFAKYGNPTPEGENDEILGVTRTDSRDDGNHLEIESNLTMGSRPIDVSVKDLQLAGLGASPILNDCSHHTFSDAINSMASIIGSID